VAGKGGSGIGRAQDGARQRPMHEQRAGCGSGAESGRRRGSWGLVGAGGTGLGARGGGGGGGRPRGRSWRQRRGAAGAGEVGDA
jgi:hypothetical protein